MISNEPERKLLRPMLRTGKGYIATVGVLSVLVLWFFYSWYTQLTQGLGVTGMRDVPGGSPWGIYMSTLIFWIGISHAGIAISASVRLMKLEEYRGIARMAELLTLFSLPMAGLTLMVDIGRPDRAINIIRFGRYQSPLIWDLTAITTYFFATLIYLYLSMRQDIAECAEVLPKRNRFYKFLSLGYENTEEEVERHNKALWWLAIAIVPIMVTVHTVISWVFGFMVARPGWYSAIFGIYFVIGAIVSGLAAVYMIAWLFRRVYGWEEYIPDKVLQGLAWALRNVLIFYIYLWIAEILTARYSGPSAELKVSEYVWTGPYAPIFWSMVLFTFAIPALILIRPMFNRTFNPMLAFIASILLNIGLWIKRVIIVIPSLLNPDLYSPGSYTPTLTEISIMMGSVWIAILLYAIFLKFFPIVELEIEGEISVEEDGRKIARWKTGE